MIKVDVEGSDTVVLKDWVSGETREIMKNIPMIAFEIHHWPEMGIIDSITQEAKKFVHIFKQLKEIGFAIQSSDINYRTEYVLNSLLPFNIRCCRDFFLINTNLVK